MKHNDLQRLIQNEMSLYCRTKVNVVRSNRRGIADLLFCVKGKFIAIEAKVGKDTLSTEQHFFLDSVEKDGGIGLVVHEKHFPIFKEFMVKFNEDQGTTPPPEIVPSLLTISKFVF